MNVFLRYFETDVVKKLSLFHERLGLLMELLCKDSALFGEYDSVRPCSNLRLFDIA